VAVELWQTQVAFAIGLLGVYIGWRGVISKMTGFYDVAGAVKYLLYGLVSGMLLAMAVDRIILPAVILSSLNIISVSLVALLIGAAEAAFVMFLMARPRVVALRGSPPYGWALGLGIGSMQVWLQRKLGDLGRHVVLHPRLTEKELETVYQRTWVVVLPSRWDTFPTVLLEAMSWGKPVVASPHGGMPEMLAGTLCRTVPPESETFLSMIRDFLKSRPLRKRVGCSLFAKAAASYNPRLVADEYVRVITATGLA